MSKGNWNGDGESSGGYSSGSETAHPELQFLAADALPFNIAVLDEDGTIVETNRAWRQFAERNGIATRPDSIGVNYLEVAKTGNDEAARKAVAGLTDLCNGNRESFELEYPCHSPDEKQWFLLQAVSVTIDESRYVTIAHINITERKEREQAIRHQRETIDRQRQLTATLNDAAHVATQATTREELFERVCETLQRSEVYSAAWIASCGPGNTLEYTTSAGFEPEVTATLLAELADPDSGAGLIEQAIESGEIQHRRELFDSPDAESWPLFSHRGDRATASVPLTDGHLTDAVLTVHTTRSTAFDDRERHHLLALGRQINTTLRAIETTQLIHATHRIEIEFRSSTADVPLIEATEALGCRLRLQQTTPASAGTFIHEFEVTGTSPDRLCDRLTSSATVEDAHRLESSEQTGTIACRVTDRCPILVLGRHGAAVRSAVFDNGTMSLTAETVPEANIRVIIEGLQQTIPETEFVSKRLVDRQPRETAREQPVAAITTLTDRQQEVLETAYHAGFFTSPRQASGEDLAESLGIAPATFYQHLRKAHQNLLTQLLEDDQDRATQ